MGLARFENRTIQFEKQGHGPPLVLLHGIGSSRRSWSHQFRDLVDAFTLIAWDAPGYGGSSDPTGEPSIAYYAETLHGFLASLNTGPVHLLGHSLGGLMAQEFYRRHRGEVRALILADTSRGGCAEPDDVRRRKLQGRLQAIEAGTPHQMAVVRAPKLLSAGAPASLVAEVVAIMSRIRPEGYRFAAKAIAAADMRDALTEVGVPTLLIWGADDSITPLAEADAMLGLIPNARLEVIPDAGHLCYLERPSLFNALVRRFLVR